MNDISKSIFDGIVEHLNDVAPDGMLRDEDGTCVGSWLAQTLVRDSSPLLRVIWITEVD